ncbi:histidinol phosphate phosphatase H [Poronia punctata]|nr:histidinol phosphate phosphatase H [Poronia punctata]
MAFTMHSHSGQFCPGHAQDGLEDIVKHAIRLGYTTMGLTEHMPRTKLEDLYPEELDDPASSLASLMPRHASYLEEAQRLKMLYAPHISLLIGFEGEWIRPAYKSLIGELAVHPAVDYFIGSLHHVNGIPIDYNEEYYDRARASVRAPSFVEQSIAGRNTSDITTLRDVEISPKEKRKDEVAQAEQNLYERYYDQQYEMLVALRPRVVGHFDLIRLLSTDPGRDMRHWPTVWDRIERNLRFVCSYGGWLECNSSALRKGLAEPYPCKVIAEKWYLLGGKFTLSDDSHSIAQIGTNYKRALEFLTSIGVTTVWTLKPDVKDKNSIPASLTGKQLLEVPVPINQILAIVNKW